MRNEHQDQQHEQHPADPASVASQIVEVDPARDETDHRRGGDTHQLFLKVLIRHLHALLRLKRRARAKQNRQSQTRQADSAHDDDRRRVHEEPRTGPVSEPLLSHSVSDGRSGYDFLGAGVSSTRITGTSPEEGVGGWALITGAG